MDRDRDKLGKLFLGTDLAADLERTYKELELKAPSGGKVTLRETFDRGGYEINKVTGLTPGEYINFGL